MQNADGQVLIRAEIDTAAVLIFLFANKKAGTG